MSFLNELLKLIKRCMCLIRWPQWISLFGGPPPIENRKCRNLEFHIRDSQMFPHESLLVKKVKNNVTSCSSQTHMCILCSLMWVKQLHSSFTWLLIMYADTWLLFSICSNKTLVNYKSLHEVPECAIFFAGRLIVSLSYQTYSCSQRNPF